MVWMLDIYRTLWCTPSSFKCATLRQLNELKMNWLSCCIIYLKPEGVFVHYCRTYKLPWSLMSIVSLQYVLRSKAKWFTNSALCIYHTMGKTAVWLPLFCFSYSGWPHWLWGICCHDDKGQYGSWEKNNEKQPEHKHERRPGAFWSLNRAVQDAECFFQSLPPRSTHSAYNFCSLSVVAL